MPSPLTSRSDHPDGRSSLSAPGSDLLLARMRKAVTGYAEAGARAAAPFVQTTGAEPRERTLPMGGASARCAGPAYEHGSGAGRCCRPCHDLPERDRCPSHQLALAAGDVGTAARREHDRRSDGRAPHARTAAPGLAAAHDPGLSGRGAEPVRHRPCGQQPGQDQGAGGRRQLDGLGRGDAGARAGRLAGQARSLHPGSLGAGPGVHRPDRRADGHLRP
jgi:hypothetical protein